MTIWNDIAKIKKPSRIFVGSTMELFGKWVKDEWMEYILRQVERKSEHTFIFLTKEPRNLIQWSPFPKNCWIGCSATNQKQYNAAIVGLECVTAKVKFISFEPLLSEIITDPAYSFEEDAIQWVAIGQQTPQRVGTAPCVSWITNIVREADIYKIPVFLKNNLRSLLPEGIPLFNKNQYELRQEFPIVV
jgi:protein gp37